MNLALLIAIIINTEYEVQASIHEAFIKVSSHCLWQSDNLQNIYTFFKINIYIK